jgi:hypothetical protein
MNLPSAILNQAMEGAYDLQQPVQAYELGRVMAAVPMEPHTNNYGQPHIHGGPTPAFHGLAPVNVQMVVSATKRHREDDPHGYADNAAVTPIPSNRQSQMWGTLPQRLVEQGGNDSTLRDLNARNSDLGRDSGRRRRMTAQLFDGAENELSESQLFTVSSTVPEYAADRRFAMEL